MLLLPIFNRVNKDLHYGIVSYLICAVCTPVNSYRFLFQYTLCTCGHYFMLFLTCTYFENY